MERSDFWGIVQAQFHFWALFWAFSIRNVFINFKIVSTNLLDEPGFDFNASLRY